MICVVVVIDLQRSELSEECNSKEKSTDAETEKSVEEEDAIAEDVEEGIEEDHKSDRKESEGFVGGIWFPNGIDFDKLTVQEDDMDLDVENLQKDKTISDANKSGKNLLKRKVKDNKKNKFLVGSNRKKTRKDLI